MSRALASAGRLTAEIRLAKAVSEFVADLSSEQKTAFRIHEQTAHTSPPGIQDVMRLTAEIDRRAGGVAGGRCFGPRLTNVLQAVQQFAALGDVIVGGTQNLVACSVWALVRMALLSVVNYSSFLDKLSTLLMVVGRSAPRYEKLALLYPRSKSLQSQISEYFIAVVRLCHQLLRLSKKSIMGQLVYFQSDTQMKSYQSELEQWAQSIREEVDLLQNEEQSSRFKLLTRFTDAKSNRQRLKVHARVLDVCCTYDYQTTWKEIRKAGHTTLFCQALGYQEWIAQNKSCTLVCTGKLGSGKSVLLANIVDDLNLSKHVVCPVAYFFCRHDISESLRARTVLGSLARQLLRPISDLGIVEDLVEDVTTLNIEAILGLLQRALPADFRAYIVLDGIDECDEGQKQTLFKQFRKLQSMFVLRLCVSFRLEADSGLKLSQEDFINQRTMAIPDDNPDIEAFINAELKRCVETGRLVVGDPALVVEIENALLHGAQGMFLWVSLQIESLLVAKTDAAIREALADLPRDLPETFSRILAKSAEQGKEYQARTLNLVIAARRPMALEELREALSVAPGDANWDPGQLLNNIYATFACCGSLLIIDEEALTVRLIHNSVRQFLLGQFKGSSDVIMTMDGANRIMGDVVVTYLNYRVFDTKVSTLVVPQIPTDIAPSRIVHSLEAPSRVRDIALAFLQSRKNPDFNMGEVLADASRLFKTRVVADQFHFYAYAKENLFSHAGHISERDPKMYGLLIRLLNNEIGHMSTEDVDVGDSEDQTLLYRAVEKGYEEVVRLLVEKGLSVVSKDAKLGRTPLHCAALHGHEGIARLLLSHGADTEARDSSSQTPLLLAAAAQNLDVVELLLDEGADAEARYASNQTPLLFAAVGGHQDLVWSLLYKGVNVEAEDDLGQTPLLLATAGGHQDIVRLLLMKDANIEAKNHLGQTPLLLAAICTHREIVELLLDKGANTEAEDGFGQTPLLLATAGGHQVIIRLLLMKDANIEAKNHLGQTPLLLAASRGRQAVVKLLLDNGADVTKKDDTGRSSLSFANEIGDEAIVQLLLDNGASAELRNHPGQTPLIWTVANRYRTAIQVLLKSGADAEKKDDSGQTPLIAAAASGYYIGTWLLLEKGAALEARDKGGRTALSWAAANGHEVVARLLLQKGARIETENGSGWTPLVLAVVHKQEAVVRLLLKKGAAVDADNSGWPPLLRAVTGGCEAIARLLLEKGANVNARDREGRTPLSWAAAEALDGVVRLLLENGADVEARDSEGCTPLSWAAAHKQDGAVRLLLACGADIEAKDGDGLTPLARAVVHNDVAMVQLLLRRGATTASTIAGRTLPAWATANKLDDIARALRERDGAAVEAKDDEDSPERIKAAL